MKKFFRLSVPAFLMPLIVLGTWIGGDCLAGDVIPISQANKLLLMIGITAGTTILFFITLIKGFGYRYKELISIVIIGFFLFAGLATAIFHTVLQSFN